MIEVLKLPENRPESRAELIHTQLISFLHIFFLLFTLFIRYEHLSTGF